MTENYCENLIGKMLVNNPVFILFNENVPKCFHLDNCLLFISDMQYIKIIHILLLQRNIFK